MRPAEEQQLKIAVQALKSGDKSTARDIFRETLRENPGLEDAWVGLSLCAETTAQKKSCLQHALAINPHHTYARSALARLEQTPQSRIVSHLPGSQQETPARANSSWTGNQIFAAFVGVLFCAACLLGGLVFIQERQKTENPAATIAAVVAQNPQPPQQPANQKVTKSKHRFIEFYADW